MFQTIFQQPDAQSTWAQARKVVDLLEPKFPQVAAYLECRFGVVGTASPRSWYRCSTYPVLQGVFFHS